MIWIVWRGSGILVLIYFFLSAWICSYFFDTQKTFGDLPYLGWSLFWAAIVTTIHALLIVVMRYGHDENDPEPPKKITHSHLFFIPVVFWPLILGGLSAKFLLMSGNDRDDYEVVAPPVVEEEKVFSRTIYFLNPTDDTMYYEISSTDGAYEKEKISPRSYIDKTLDPGKYYISGIDLEGNVVFSFPSGKVTKDKSKSTIAKNHDKASVYHRIIGDGTETEKDCDDIWVVLNGERDMMMVDVTSICHDSLTKSEVEKTDWTKLVTSYDGTDIIEPLYEEDPGKGTFTVLTTGDDIPTSTKKNERVYAMFSYARGTELTNEYLAKRIVKRCPDVSEK